MTWLLTLLLNNWVRLTVTFFILYLIRVLFLRGIFTTLKKNLKGKRIIVTGSSAGIGKATAIQLLQDGAEVIFACRNQVKTEKVFEEIKKINPSLIERAHFLHIDLVSFKSVQKFVNEFDAKFGDLDILINNAATYPRDFGLTEDKLDFNYQENYFSLVLLTKLLLKNFKNKEGRILNLASFAHIQCDFTEESIDRLFKDKSFECVVPYYTNLWIQHYHYANTKTAIIYFSSHFAETLEKSHPHIKCVSVNPGLVYTEFGRFVSEHWFLGYVYSVSWWIYQYIAKTALGGAQSTLHCCYLDFPDLVSGSYYSDCKVGKLAAKARDSNLRNKFVENTYDLLKKVLV
jgi:NAD(P)-dependent dehydrogenase (short-subunit alcohol dehydrogenase family)